MKATLNIAASATNTSESASHGAGMGQTAVFDGVEAALATALTEAAKAGRFDVVSQVARELEARRLAGAGNVVAIDAKTRGRR